MITITDLNRMIAELNLRSEYREKPAYFDTVVSYWEKKANRANASEEAKRSFNNWTRVAENWAKMNAKSPAMYPSVYMGCAWVAPLTVMINGIEYVAIQIYEPERTDDSKTHWGWGIDDGHGNLIQQWPTLHCNLNKKVYKTVDELIAEWPEIIKNFALDEDRKHVTLSRFFDYYSLDALIAHGGIDGHNA